MLIKLKVTNSGNEGGKGAAQRPRGEIYLSSGKGGEGGVLLNLNSEALHEGWGGGGGECSVSGSKET